MGYEEVFKKRLVVIDQHKGNEQMGWFDGRFNEIIRLTWKNESISQAYTYLFDHNELVCLGKFLAEFEKENNTILKIELFNPAYDKAFREVDKENIYSYRKAKENLS